MHPVVFWTVANVMALTAMRAAELGGLSIVLPGNLALYLTGRAEIIFF